MNWIVTSSSPRNADAYLEWLLHAGLRGLPAVPDSPAPDTAGATALLLSGGGDVAPHLYGAEPDPETGPANGARDEMELRMTREFMQAGKPVFGICRGIQVLNVAMGGGLIQHIPRWITQDLRGEIHKPGGKGDTVHDVRTTEGSPLGDALRGVTSVNSCHHQALDPARLAPGLEVVCVSPAGVIEAVESVLPGQRISAVQWHPERLPAEHQASQCLLSHWLAVARSST